MIIKRVHSCGPSFLIFHVLPLFYFSQQIIVYQPRALFLAFLQSSFFLFYADRSTLQIYTHKITYARVVLSLYTTTLSVLTTLFCFLEDVLLLFYVQTSLFGSSLYLLYNQSNTIVDLFYCIHTWFLLSLFIIHISFPCCRIIIISSHWILNKAILWQVVSIYQGIRTMWWINSSSNNNMTLWPPPVATQPIITTTIVAITTTATTGLPCRPQHHLWNMEHLFLASQRRITAAAALCHHTSLTTLLWQKRKWISFLVSKSLTWLLMDIWIIYQTKNAIRHLLIDHAMLWLHVYWRIPKTRPYRLPNSAFGWKRCFSLCHVLMDPSSYVTTISQ